MMLSRLKTYAIEAIGIRSPSLSWRGLHPTLRWVWTGQRRHMRKR